MDALECDVAGELCLDDRADVRNVGSEVVHVADCSAGGDGGLDLAACWGFLWICSGVPLPCGHMRLIHDLW